MRNGEKLNLEQIRAFSEASEEVEFGAENRQEGALPFRNLKMRPVQ